MFSVHRRIASPPAPTTTAQKPIYFCWGLGIMGTDPKNWLPRTRITAPGVEPTTGAWKLGEPPAAALEGWGQPPVPTLG